MVLVQAGNDALASILKESRQHLRVYHDCVLAVLANNTRESIFRLVRVGDLERKSFTIVAEEVAPTEVARETIKRLLRKAGHRRLTDFVFREQSSSEADYRREWVLVDRDSLKLRLLNGQPLRSSYNPTI